MGVGLFNECLMLAYVSNSDFLASKKIGDIDWLMMVHCFIDMMFMFWWERQDGQLLDAFRPEIICILISSLDGDSEP